MIHSILFVSIVLYIASLPSRLSTHRRCRFVSHVYHLLLSSKSIRSFTNMVQGIETAELKKLLNASIEGEPRMEIMPSFWVVHHDLPYSQGSSLRSLLQLPVGPHRECKDPTSIANVCSIYSVGAALLCDDGTLIKGCNVENASYGQSFGEILANS